MCVRAVNGAQCCVLCRAQWSSTEAFEAHYQRLHYAGAFEAYYRRLPLEAHMTLTEPSPYGRPGVTSGAEAVMVHER